MKFTARKVRRGAAVTSGVALVALLAACGSGGGTSGGTGEADVDAAKETVARYQEWFPGTFEELLPGPLSAPAPEGKRIAFLGCSLPSCDEIGDFVEEAAGELGWTVDRFSIGGSPEDIQAAYNSMISTKPDAAFALGFTETQVEEQIKEMNELGIPYFVGGTTDTPGDGNQGAVYTIPDQQTMGKIMAGWVVDDSDGKANTVYFNTSAVTSLAKKYEAFEKEYFELCPECTLDEQNVIATDIGKGFPSQAVSYLQSHPDVDYIVFGNGAIATGVTQRLDEAGLSDQIRAITSNGGRPVWEEIATGNSPIVVDVPVNNEYYAWALVDRAARSFVGDPTTGKDFHETDGLSQPFKLLTKDNIGDDLEVISGPEGFKEDFLEYWGQ